MSETVLHWLGLWVVASPFALTAALGLPSLFRRGILSETAIVRLVEAANVTGLFSSLAILALMLVNDTTHVVVEFGDWVHIPDFHFHVKFLFDRLSVPFVILTYLLCGTIGAFARSYMHREPGFARFFFLYSMFVTGMIVTATAGTVETLFAGWELVGLSSAMLVAFFHERPAPVRNGLRVWIVYRVADAALLVGAVVLHHLHGHGDFDELVGRGNWPLGVAAVSPREALIVGLLFLVAAAGKSALVPFSGWLPRAMEGPTPSSAVFYGALSVHLGAFLLLRISPLLEQSWWLSGAVIAVGAATALFASIAGRVQTDIKAALCFASLTQVGIIVAEIGCGLRYIPLIHILGHGCLRILQFVRAPSILMDYRNLEDAIGARLPRHSTRWERMVPDRLRTWLYRLSLERGYLDAWLSDYVADPFLRVFRWCDAAERRFTDLLAGGRSRESDAVKPHPAPFEDLK